ncbi:MAG: hypothetical protein ACOC92_01100 [bacterium]
METTSPIQQPYLEVTFRHGRPLAAYLCLPRGAGQKVSTSRPVGQGLVVDLDQAGVPVGIEITTPSTVTLAALNGVLRGHGMAEITEADLEPLRAA